MNWVNRKSIIPIVKKNLNLLRETSIKKLKPYNIRNYWLGFNKYLW